MKLPAANRAFEPHREANSRATSMRDESSSIPQESKPQQVRHDRDDARGRAPLEEPSTRLAERHERGPDRVVIGGHERVPVALADLRVEAVPELTTLLAQRIDACAELPLEVGLFVSRYQAVPTRAASRPRLHRRRALDWLPLHGWNVRPSPVSSSASSALAASSRSHSSCVSPRSLPMHSTRALPSEDRATSDGRAPASCAQGGVRRPSPLNVPLSPVSSLKTSR